MISAVMVNLFAKCDESLAPSLPRSLIAHRQPFPLRLPDFPGIPAPEGILVARACPYRFPGSSAGSVSTGELSSSGRRAPGICPGHTEGAAKPGSQWSFLSQEINTSGEMHRLQIWIEQMMPSAGSSKGCCPAPWHQIPAGEGQESFIRPLSSQRMQKHQGAVAVAACTIPPAPKQQRKPTTATTKGNK